MKRVLILTLVLFILSFNYANSQLSKLVKTVKANVQNELAKDKNQNQKTGNDTPKTLPEPAGSCADAQLIMDLGGTLKIDYTEIGITIGDDGRLLVQDRLNSNYYIVKDGVTQGPFSKGDPALADFGITKNGDDRKSLSVKYKNYITKVGDKFLITVMDKKYGPYAQINMFAITKSKEKFAASVTENVPVTEDKAKKMEEAMKNAKTDQEKMNLSMQFAMEMQSQMMNNGGTSSILPKFITNIPGAVYDPAASSGATFNGNLKYDDILLSSYDKIMDLKGNSIMSITPGSINPDEFYISSDNSNYASYSYGTITFKNKTTLTDVFNPHWLKVNGKVYLAYMYYSPKRNSIMQCKLPF
jgi:hypothetical protein